MKSKIGYVLSGPIGHAANQSQKVLIIHNFKDNFNYCFNRFKKLENKFKKQWDAFKQVP